MKGRVCIVGGSYGGYAALWGVIRNPEIYRCAASWAGVTDCDSQLKYDRSFFSRKGSKNWRARIEGDTDGFDLDSVSPYRLAETLTRPVLLAHGKDDDRVPFSQFKKMEKASRDGPGAVGNAGHRRRRSLVLQTGKRKDAGTTLWKRFC